MASQSSVLAWNIPWTEEPGGLHPWAHEDLDTTGRLSRFTQAPIASDTRFSESPRPCL